MAPACVALPVEPFPPTPPAPPLPPTPPVTDTLPVALEFETRIICVVPFIRPTKPPPYAAAPAPPAPPTPAIAAVPLD